MKEQKRTIQVVQLTIVYVFGEYMKKHLHYSVMIISVLIAFISVTGGVFAETTDVLAFTAASLTGASNDLGTAFESAYPDYTVTWNLAGTQELKTQVENGATPDIFISASAKYTKEMKNGGWYINDTVSNLTSNWIIAILPKDNPAEITSLADLSKSGLKIAMGTEDVPVGINTRKIIDKMANTSEYGPEWKDAVYANTVTYEVTEPGVVEKVKLGEVDAGFVYQSSFSASQDALEALEITKELNEIQFYSVAAMTEAPNQAGAAALEEFLLSDEGQEILDSYGFTPVS